MSNSQITRRALAHSLKELMQHVPLNKITVNALTRHCGVNRQTFYYHYHDIYELLGWIYQTEALESIQPYPSSQTWKEAIYNIFDYIESNKQFCLNTLNSLARSHLDSYLYAVTHKFIIGVVQELSAGMHVREEDKEFLANFYTLAFTGLVIQWLQNGMTAKPKELIGKLNELIQGNFTEALRRYEHLSLREGNTSYTK
ncbi:dihydroxyacetone kinase transcriptional activator DhaS [Paenibacillus sp. CAA11]|uniref:TetR-like C-terminal domain-containing protein n=1 Tax=Paenibacillus sp. CAA11 TaxID=1532905 RepID=UPI000D396093|nr:TetR-like C-terminal domain-containing protein [Paenibacillus sp. CAA11]AWB43879.1 dihydroxyacetone kinase transcriptional activator DhaS [Paenibacillus sp. CAA11]